MPSLAKVVHVSTVHSAHDVRILLKECFSLSGAGYDVSFVVPHDREECVSGVNIVPLPARGNRFVRILFAPWRACHRALGLGAEVYHLHDPELIPPGLVLKLLKKKVIVDVHEDLPAQIMSKPWLPTVLRRPVAMLADMMERVAGRVVDALVAATPGIGAKLSGRRIAVVQNFPKYEELLADDQWGYEERPAVFVYVGGITAIRGAREMVEAIGRVPESYHAELWLVGRFESDTLRDELQQLPGWQKTRYFGVLDREAVREVMGKARAGLVLYHPEPNHEEAQPTKLFEYLSAAIPAVASDFRFWRDTLGLEHVSVFTDPTDTDEIAGAMRRILDDPSAAKEMGARGRVAVERTFNWEQEARKLVDLYGELL